jgi:hypothetical protein
MNRSTLAGNLRLLGGALALGLVGLSAPSVQAQAEKPKYGGSLSIGTNSPSLAPLSWDPADWNYKTAQDAGFYYDRLFGADFTKSKAQGGPYLFKSDSYIPPPTPSGAIWPKAGSGSIPPCGSRSSCARASCSRKSPASWPRAS